MRYLIGVLSYTTLKMNMNSISRFFLQSGLTGKLGLREPVLSIYLRKSLHTTLTDYLSNLNIEENYKSYLKAIVLKHEKNYKEASSLIAKIDDSKIINFKTRLLYDRKAISSLVALSNKGEDVLAQLTAEQQVNLVSYLTSRNMYDTVEQMIQQSEADKEYLIQQLEADRENVYLKYSWNSYVEKVLEIHSHIPLSVKTYRNKIDAQDSQMRNLGYVLLVNHYYQKEAYFNTLNNEVVPFFKDKVELYQYIEPAALHTFDFKIDEDNTKGLQLQKILNYYHTETHSKHMMKSILELIPEVNLNHQHLMSLRRMIVEGHLNIRDKGFESLFKKDRRLHTIFHYPKLFLENSVKDEVDSFIHQNLPLRDRKKIYTHVIKQLILIKQPMKLPSHFVDYLESTHDKRLANAYVLARHYYNVPDQEAREEMIQGRTVDKQFKLRLYLAKYLFHFKMYEQSLYETKQASLIKPNHPDVIRNFIRNYHIMGNITERYKSVLKMKKSHSARLYQGEYEIAKHEYELFNHEWQLNKTYEPVEGTDDKSILFVLNKALPVLNGYTIRSHEMISGIRNRGYRPIVATRLGWSPEHDGYKKPDKQIGDIPTYYLDRSEKYLSNKTPLSRYFSVYADEVYKVIKKEKPSIIHAASNFQNALPALKVAQSLGLKSIYEVRGLWHYTQSEKNPDFYRSERFKMQDDYEIICCKVADEVTCISESLKNYLVEKGIPKEKITVIPNGVDTNVLKPIPKAVDIIDKYELENSTVIGFIGSLTSYEGIEFIFEAMKEINNRKKKKNYFKFLIVGDGSYRSKLEQKVKELEIEEDVIFVGRVPREEVIDFYSVIDIAPFPRKNDPVCQLVTPIKTYEAMAMEKKVIVSDVDALKEMVKEGVNGRLFKAENVNELKETILKIAEDKKIGAESRDWVVKHREWKILLSKLIPLYEKAS
ncbi:glycosyltransferase [Salinicoccus cyprini]|uniref:Glycosyltransferase n=1 Tax=Salinicoccus cyprini TaxID=2493691 RepID=A0A558AX86_9STAP|nr:glycosyltransferase family 4 protein [Salinicoccus cyprini]TVT28875.1 glycosyltransferase [Salinicoccus cyprini]